MIDGLSRRLRGRLTYATVVSAISAFIVLAGGAAWATSQLGKNSVGAKQLKKSSVTAAKIKKNAVTSAKIKKNAVSAAKFKPSSVGRTSIDLESTPYTRVVHQATSSGPVVLGADDAPIPLIGSTYTQPPGRDDFYFGVATVTIPESCEGPTRRVFVEAYVDLADPNDRADEEVAIGAAELEGSGAATRTIALRPEKFRFQPAAATGRTISVYAVAICENEPASATVDSVTVQVAGTR